MVMRMREGCERRDRESRAAAQRCSGVAVRATVRLEPAEVEALYNLYLGEWWAAGRERAEIRSMLAHSDLLFAATATAEGRLVGFARVLSDWVYKAMVFDVIVARAERGRGIGSLLLRTIVEHPLLGAVRHLELYCLPELIPFYKGWGFATDFSGVCLMRRQGGRGGGR